MSGVELTRGEHSPPVIGCYGKLPAAGDFLSRRLPREVVLAWDEWLQQGLLHLRAQDAAGWEQRYLAAPPWSLLVPAAVARGHVLIGVIAPSRDRVGRPFPVCLLLALRPERVDRSLLRRVPALCAALAEVASAAVRDRWSPDRVDEAIERTAARELAEDRGSGADILDVLGSAATELDATTVPLGVDLSPWPGLARDFDTLAMTSHWWTFAGGRGLRGFVHDGRLDGSLFATLFAGESPRPRGAGSLS